MSVGVPGVSTSVWVMSGKAVEEKPDLIRKYQRGFMKGRSLFQHRAEFAAALTDLQQGKPGANVVPHVLSEQYPVINAARSDFDVLLATLPDVAGRSRELLARLRALGLRDHAVVAVETAIMRATSAGDVVATALATAVYRQVTGTTHPAHDDAHALSDGWTTVLTLLRLACLRWSRSPASGWGLGHKWTGKRPSQIARGR
mgnify:CR=1 FL=1